METREALFRWRGITPLPFFIAALMGARFSLPLFIAGLTLSLVGETIRLWSVSYAGGPTRTRKVGAPSLVTDGPYSLVRNPLYIGNILHYTGFSLSSGAFFPYLTLSTLLYFSIQYTLIVQLEEKTLKDLFAEQYLRYLQRVPRFLPTFQNPSFPAPPLTFRQALRCERSTLGAFILTWGILVVRFTI